MRGGKQRAMDLLGIVRGCKERRVLNVCKHLCIFIFLERARSLCFFSFWLLVPHLHSGADRWIQMAFFLLLLVQNMTFTFSVLSTLYTTILFDRDHVYALSAGYKIPFCLLRSEVTETMS